MVEEEEDDNYQTLAFGVNPALLASDSISKRRARSHANVLQHPQSPRHRGDQRAWKILVIGEISSGKTAFINRVVNEHFTHNYRATIGVDFSEKVCKLRKVPYVVRSQLWDIAGQERFGSMTKIYFRSAIGALVVCDISNAESFEKTVDWKRTLDNETRLPDKERLVPCLLVINKCDLKPDPDFPKDRVIQDFVKEHGFYGYVKTSALTGDMCAEALQNLLMHLHAISADKADDDKPGVVQLAGSTNPFEKGDGGVKATGQQEEDDEEEVGVGTVSVQKCAC